MLKIETSTAITDPEDWGSLEWHNSSFVYRQAQLLRELHPWHGQGSFNNDLHPAVVRALRSFKPSDWRQVVFEWPHVSEDKARIAYTRSAEKGIADVQTVTAPGKYIKRHWPDLKDDVIRDIVYMARDKSGCSILNDVEEICEAIDSGPFSCMQGKEINGHHPYEVYCPSLGWALAVRRDQDGDIVGRALVLVTGAHKCYVRSYRGSGTDDELDAYMEELGYHYRNGWPIGTRLAAIQGRQHDQSEEWVFPYIDGSHDQVEYDGENLVISSDGPWTCANQDGSAEYEDEDRETCDDCGDDSVDEDDIRSVGEDSDHQVCESCCNRRYTLAIGRSGVEYYVRDNAVTVVNDRAYDDNYMHDNGLVELADGDWVHQDDAVYCAEAEAYYLPNDPEIVKLENGVVCHKDHAWQCYASGNWYLEVDSYERVEVDGEVYHCDYVPSQDAEEAILAPLGGYDKTDGDIPNEAQIGLTLVSVEKATSSELFVGPPRYERFCVEPAPPRPDGTYWDAAERYWNYKPKPDGVNNWVWDKTSNCWFVPEQETA